MITTLQVHSKGSYKTCTLPIKAILHCGQWAKVTALTLASHVMLVSLFADAIFSTA